jgi:tight adherence protein B
MISLVLAACAAVGAHLLVTPGEWTLCRSLAGRVRRKVGCHVDDLSDSLDETGVPVTPSQFLLASAAVGAGALVLASSIAGMGPASAVVGGTAAAVPPMLLRRRRHAARQSAQEAWPRLIEEIRVLAGAGGRSLPQALLDVGLRGPEPMRAAFHAAQREWALTTNFDRTVTVLKHRLKDPTADAVCETLLIAAAVGGDIDRRLMSLAEDRRQDLLGRKEAEARQAGARLARAFVVLVPAGMALAGLNVGEGAAAYRTGQGQILVAAGVALIVVCWVWAGRVMRLPEPLRVLDR